MNSLMATTTQPDNQKRFTVIRMVHLRFRRAAITAVRFFNLAASKINVCIRSGIRSIALFVREWIQYPQQTHVFGMTFQTIPLSSSSWFPTFTHIVNVEQEDNLVTWNIYIGGRT